VLMSRGSSMSSEWSKGKAEIGGGDRWLEAGAKKVVDVVSSVKGGVAR